MGIKGLTDKARLDLDARGRTVRLGFLQKGAKTTKDPNLPAYGKNIVLSDFDFFRFRPVASDAEQAQAMERIFNEVYGVEPRSIGDVRLTADLAGNFHPDNCAWLLANIYGPKGMTFLARSDGEYIRQMRNPKTGKVEMFDAAGNAATLPEYVRRHDDHTRLDGEGKACFVWEGKLIPWQQSMAIDLILPAFNRRLYEEGIAGHGVITFITHGSYDIPVLIDEYHGILNEVMSLFAGALNGSAEVARNHIPLRNIPLRLFRSEDKITTPDYRSKDPASRLHSTRWNCHWQLAPEFAASMQAALDQRTQMTLAAVANMPLLVAGARPSIDQINDDLFGGGSITRVLPAVAATPPSSDPWGADEDVDPGTLLEGELEPPDSAEWEVEAPPPTDWQAEALRARDVSEWAIAAFQLPGTGNVLQDAAATRRWYEHVIGQQFNPQTNDAALAALDKYTHAVADGAKKPAAIEAAKKIYQTAQIPF